MSDEDYRPRVKVKRSTAGLGLFADEDISRDQLIIEYTGERISSDEADRRGGLYLFTVNKKLVIDGKDRKNISRYINHSCKPNAEAEVDDKEKRIYIRARKKIRKGEEIAYDYGKEYTVDMFKEKPCRCDVCRGKRTQRRKHASQ